MRVSLPADSGTGFMASIHMIEPAYHYPEVTHTE
jgi:hypothetical protein